MRLCIRAVSHSSYYVFAQKAFHIFNFITECDDDDDCDPNEKCVVAMGTCGKK